METLAIVLRIVCGVVVLDLILTTASPRSVLKTWTGRMLDPAYRPIRSILDPGRLGVDFAPMVAVGALVLLAYVLTPAALGCG